MIYVFGVIDRARYLDPIDSSHALAGLITRSRERMSATHKKDFTSVCE